MHGGTRKRLILFSVYSDICYYLHCDVGDILKFDGNLEVEEDSVGEGIEQNKKEIFQYDGETQENTIHIYQLSDTGWIGKKEKKYVNR